MGGLTTRFRSLSRPTVKGEARVGVVMGHLTENGTGVGATNGRADRRGR
jgi:hypothetical protein